MEIKYTEKETVIFYLVMLIFATIGCFTFILEGIFPKEIKIEPTEKAVNAHIIRTDGLVLPPFKKADYLIKNVKQAVIVKDKMSILAISIPTYGISLELYDGYKYSIMHETLGFYSSKVELKDQINDSIQNRTPFSKMYIEKGHLLFGIVYMLVAIPLILHGFAQLKRIDEEGSSKTDEQEEDEYEDDYSQKEDEDLDD